MTWELEKLVYEVQNNCFSTNSECNTANGGGRKAKTLAVPTMRTGPSRLPAVAPLSEAKGHSRKAKPQSTLNGLVADAGGALTVQTALNCDNHGLAPASNGQARLINYDKGIVENLESPPNPAITCEAIIAAFPCEMKLDMNADRTQTLWGPNYAHLSVQEVLCPSLCGYCTVKGSDQAGYVKATNAVGPAVKACKDATWAFPTLCDEFHASGGTDWFKCPQGVCLDKHHPDKPEDLVFAHICPAKCESCEATCRDREWMLEFRVLVPCPLIMAAIALNPHAVTGGVNGEDVRTTPCLGSVGKQFNIDRFNDLMLEDVCPGTCNACGNVGTHFNPGSGAGNPASWNWGAEGQKGCTQHPSVYPTTFAEATGDPFITHGGKRTQFY
eukprot:gene13091-45817_t